MEKAWKIWEEMRKLSLSNTLDTEKRTRLAALYKRYNESLPLEFKDTALVILGEKGTRVIHRDEIPKLILEDDEVYKMVLKWLSIPLEG